MGRHAGEKIITKIASETMSTTGQLWIAVGTLLLELIVIGVVLIWGFREEWRGLDDDPDEVEWTS